MMAVSIRQFFIHKISLELVIIIKIENRKERKIL